MNFIAHRGLNGKYYRENTMDAILHSLKEDYVVGVEIDIRLTKDKQFVLVHDMTINRVSDGSGFVSQMTLSELRKYNFGNKNHKSLITTLDDVLLIFPKDKILLIEVKCDQEAFEVLLPLLWKSLKPYLKKNIYICSFQMDFLRQLKVKYPKIKIGALSSKPIVYVTPISCYLFGYRYFTEFYTDYMIMLWTVNKEKDYQKLKGKLTSSMYIITDYASRLHGS